MHGQHAATDGTVDGLVAGREPTAAIASLYGTPPNRKEDTMTQVETFEEAPAASLVGSLSVFTLSDVLTMLAATAQTGELQLVSDVVDGKLWLAQGELSNAHVGTATTVGQAVFELACIAEGWFYFTSGLSSSNGQPSIPVATMLSDVRPQVDEWRELRQVVPLEATVSLSPTSPGHDVQIRSDQWQVLTTVGHGGHTVKTVIESIGGDQMVGMRSIRDLRTAGLIVLGAPTTELVPDQLADSYRMATQESVPSASLPAPPPPVTTTDELAGYHPDLDAVTNSDEQLGDLAAVSLMPPPIASDPWSPVVEASAGASDNGVA
jgi:hypothetical protein